MPYLPRVVDAELETRLAAAGAVVIEGPKASGKTETARQRVASSVLLDVDENTRQAAAVDPSLVLEGPTPRLIDEWQIEPAMWNHVRRAVDNRGIAGQFILTGSSVPADDVARHTGAGRFSFLRMRPMTLFDTGHTNGAISLAALLAGEPARSEDPGLSVRDLAERIAAGGWPAQHGRRVADAARAARDRPGADPPGRRLPRGRVAPGPGQGRAVAAFAGAQYLDRGGGKGACSRRRRR